LRIIAARAPTKTSARIRSFRLARSPDHKIAELIGVSQGYYSKLQVKIAEKMRAGRKKWRAANGLPEFDEPFLEYTPSYPAHRHLYGDEND